MTGLKKTLGALTVAATALLGSTALAAEVPTLRFIVPFGGTATYTNAGVKAVEEKLNPILEERIGAHVELSPIAMSDYNQRMTLINSSREPYDIAMTAPWTNNFYNNITQGNLMALNDYLPEAPELLDAVSAELLAVGTVGGKLYGIPIEQMFPKTFGPVFNKSFADKYDFGPDDINSWADLTPIFERIVAGEEPGIYPAAGRLHVLPELLGYDPVISGNVGYGVVKMDDTSLSVVNMYETPEYRDLVKLRRQWHENGLDQSQPDESRRALCWPQGSDHRLRHRFQPGPSGSLQPVRRAVPGQAVGASGADHRCDECLDDGRFGRQ